MKQHGYNLAARKSVVRFPHISASSAIDTDFAEVTAPAHLDGPTRSEKL